MRQPAWYEVKGKEHQVCKLRRSIYGLKQSPRCWNSTLDRQLGEMGFVQTKSDPCLYVSTGEEPFVLTIYVDDILVAGGRAKQIQEVKNALASRFHVKDLGELKYFLGVKVVQNRDKGTIWIGQPVYSKQLFVDFQMLDAKSTKTPVNPGLKLVKASDDIAGVNIEEYQSAVGKLLYLSTKTRPDLAFAVSSIARITVKPTEEHWKAVKYIFRYLVGTLDYGILYSQKGETECSGYSDADWGGDLNDRKSTSGYIFCIALVGKVVSSIHNRGRIYRSYISSSRSSVVATVTGRSGKET